MIGGFPIGSAPFAAIPTNVVPFTWHVETSRPTGRLARRATGSETTAPPAFVQLDWLTAPAQPRKLSARTRGDGVTAPPTVIPFDWLAPQPAPRVKRPARSPDGFTSPFALSSDGVATPPAIHIVVSVPDPRAVGGGGSTNNTGGGGAGFATAPRRKGSAYPGPSRLLVRVNNPVAVGGRNRRADDERWLLAHLLDLDGIC